MKKSVVALASSPARSPSTQLQPEAGDLRMGAVLLVDGDAPEDARGEVRRLDDRRVLG